MTTAKKNPRTARSPKKASGAGGRGAYEARLEQLLQAITISEDVVRASRAYGKRERAQLLASLAQTRTMAESPEPAFRNVRSLKYLEETVVQPWNEQVGAEVEAFWRRAAEAGLDYKRKDVIRDVLSRGRIRDEFEYEIVVDRLVGLEQEGKITARESASLSTMIGAFERKRAPRRTTTS